MHGYSDKAKTAWATSMIVEVVCYWAVPIFLMLTGATLMKYREKYDTKTYFKKRIMKVFIPFIIWATIMTIWKCSIGVLKINDFSIKNILNIFFSNGEETTYYFMFLILGIYLTIPLLSVLSEEKNRKICWYTVIAIFVTKSILPIILKMFGVNYNTSLAIQLGDWAIYPLLGYLFSTHNFTKKQRTVIYILGILAAIFRYSMTYYWTTTSHVLNKTLFGYTQFHSVLLSSAVFVFIKNIDFNKKIESEKITKFLSKIASCSFGIYLIHQIVMYYEKSIFVINSASWQWRTLGVISTYLISLSIVYLLKKIPVVRKIVP